MRLLYINDELAGSDGSNSHAMGMMSAFKRILGEENIVCYPDPEDGSGKPVNYGANVLRRRLKAILPLIRCVRKKLLSVKKSKLIIAELKQKGFYPTHVLARATDFDVTAIYVAKELDAKLIYEVNTPQFYERGVIRREMMIGALEKWEKRIIEASDYVYVVSNICRDMLCEHHGCRKDKFIVVPNGYMAELYTEKEEEKKKIREAIRKEEGLEDKFVVTFVGSLKVWHGIKKFCETAELMQSDKNVCFLVLGDGEMHDMIADYAKNHDNIVFKGKVSLETMKRYLYTSDLGIMPYEQQENFYFSPLKMFDMIGAGLPFLGTAVGQIEEICTEESLTNMLIHDTDPEAIRKKILEMYKGREELQCTANIINGMKENHSWYKRTNILLDSIGQ